MVGLQNILEARVYFSNLIYETCSETGVGPLHGLNQYVAQSQQHFWDPLDPFKRFFAPKVPILAQGWMQKINYVATHSCFTNPFQPTLGDIMLNICT